MLFGISDVRLIVMSGPKPYQGKTEDEGQKTHLSLDRKSKNTFSGFSIPKTKKTYEKTGNAAGLFSHISQKEVMSVSRSPFVTRCL